MSLDPDTIRQMHAAIDSGWAFIAYGLTIEALDDDEPIVSDSGDGTITFRGRVRPADPANCFIASCMFTPGLTDDEL